MIWSINSNEKNLSSHMNNSLSMFDIQMGLPIVIDNGSLMTKVGIAGYDTPSSVFTTVFGRSKYPCVSLGCWNSDYFGE